MLKSKLNNYLGKYFGFLYEPALRQELEQHCTLQTFHANTPLMKEGDYVKTLPLVVKGSIKVFREDNDKEILLYYVTQSESCIMCISACMHDQKSKVKIVVEEDSEVIILPARFVRDWFRNYPSWNRFVIDLYQKRFETILDAFHEVAFQKVDDRLKNYLIKKSALNNSKIVKVTHQQIADDIGTAREVVSRLLKQLEKEDKIILGRGKITIK